MMLTILLEALTCHMTSQSFLILGFLRNSLGFFWGAMWLVLFCFATGLLGGILGCSGTGWMVWFGVAEEAEGKG